MAVESFLVPGQKRLPGKMRSETRCPAIDFSSLKGQIDGVPTLVTAHDFEFESQSLSQDSCHNRREVRSSSGGAALGRLGSSEEIVQRLPGRVGSDVQ